MFKMLMWSTDDAGRAVVLIDGKAYTHEEAKALHDELGRVLEPLPLPQYDAAAHAAAYPGF